MADVPVRSHSIRVPSSLKASSILQTSSYECILKEAILSLLIDVCGEIKKEFQRPVNYREKLNQDIPLEDANKLKAIGQLSGAATQL